MRRLQTMGSLYDLLRTPYIQKLGLFPTIQSDFL